MRIESLSYIRTVNIGRRMLVNPRRRFSDEAHLALAARA
jgi:hypothetical protein